MISQPEYKVRELKKDAHWNSLNHKILLDEKNVLKFVSILITEVDLYIKIELHFIRVRALLHWITFFFKLVLNPGFYQLFTEHFTVT
jgi:hypothetical protein